MLSPQLREMVQSFEQLYSIAQNLAILRSALTAVPRPPPFSTPTLLFEDFLKPVRQLYSINIQEVVGALSSAVQPSTLMGHIGVLVTFAVGYVFKCRSPHEVQQLPSFFLYYRHFMLDNSQNGVMMVKLLACLRVGMSYVLATSDALARGEARSSVYELKQTTATGPNSIPTKDWNRKSIGKSGAAGAAEFGGGQFTEHMQLNSYL